MRATSPAASSTRLNSELAGTFNAVAPPTTRGDLIETCRLAAA